TLIVRVATVGSYCEICEQFVRRYADHWLHFLRIISCCIL
ncbi:hypothetical protein TNCT_257791, partial [Trichonephila clavata]